MLFPINQFRDSLLITLVDKFLDCISSLFFRQRRYSIIIAVGGPVIRNYRLHASIGYICYYWCDHPDSASQTYYTFYCYAGIVETAVIVVHIRLKKKCLECFFFDCSQNLRKKVSGYCCSKSSVRLSYQRQDFLTDILAFVGIHNSIKNITLSYLS